MTTVSPTAPPSPTSDDELAARAAWLHYAGGLTQSAVAKRLGLQPTRAHRLIARASREGLVRVIVDCEVAACIELENRIVERYGLRHCTVVPDIGDDPALPLGALSRGGSRFLLQVLELHEHDVIGIGHGRTLSSVVDALPASGVANTTFVSMLGGLTEKFAANPYDVIFRLAEKGGAKAYLMPAPMFVDSADDRASMLRQTGLREVMRQIDAASLCLLGIGTLDVRDAIRLGSLPDASDAPQKKLRQLGVVAELLGQFLDARGRRVATPFDERVMAPSLESLEGREVVAVAGGEYKRAAIAAALAGGWLTGLITDEATARHLVDTAH